MTLGTEHQYDAFLMYGSGQGSNRDTSAGLHVFSVLLLLFTGVAIYYVWSITDNLYQSRDQKKKGLSYVRFFFFLAFFFIQSTILKDELIRILHVYYDLTPIHERYVGTGESQYDQRTGQRKGPEIYDHGHR